MAQGLMDVLMKRQMSPRRRGQYGPVPTMGMNYQPGSYIQNAMKGRFEMSKPEPMMTSGFEMSKPEPRFEMSRPEPKYGLVNPGSAARSRFPWARF